MKLGEAILERVFLEEFLERLGSRLRGDFVEGRLLTQTLLEIERTVKRSRDLKIAIDWTLQQMTVAGTPLGSYFFRIEQLQKVAAMLESVNSPDVREKVEELLEASKEAEKLVETIKWAQDLLIPEIKIPKNQSELEEEN